MSNRNQFFVILIIIIGVTVFTNAQSFQEAEKLYKQGKFVEAQKALSKNSNDYETLVLKGHLALLGNRLSDAKKHLEKAAKLKPEEKTPKQLLGELFYRQNNFQKASQSFQSVGRETVAKKLASFAGKQPYLVESKLQSTKIKFIKTDPLPVVTARINDGEELNFLIDTGGGELIVDEDFVAKNNIIQFGEETGTFGGGRRSAFQQGKIDSFTLGEFKIRNVPINILKTQRFAPVLGVKSIDGIIGSILLSRFISTLDYQNGELVLRKTNKANLTQLEKSMEVPFWMAGDHFLVAWGSVNKSPQLLFIDTGLAGMGFTGPESTLKEANISLGNQSSEGVGGGGNIKVTPFVVDEITLGEAQRQKIGGVAGAFPASLENSLGFRLGGLISHSFFRPYKITFDFIHMKILIADQMEKKKLE